jgi:hypothetical protein
MAGIEEKEWVASVDKWNAEVDRRDPVRTRTVPLLPAWKLANSMQWVLCWGGLEVTGPTAKWARETLQNTYSTNYLRKQSAGLFRSQAVLGQCMGEGEANRGGDGVAMGPMGVGSDRGG